MAVKKSFKTEWNPALQFISMPQEDEVEAGEGKESAPGQTEDLMKGLTAPSEAAPEPAPAQAPESLKEPKAPEGYKVNPLYVETKSRRLQLLMQPSVYERVKERAGAAGQSVNEWIHACLEEASQ